MEVELGRVKEMLRESRVELGKRGEEIVEM
jgi:hypothetical protein